MTALRKSPLQKAPPSLLRALANPGEALFELNKLDAQDSLYRFVQLLWPVLEPGREFVPGWPAEAICEHLEAVHHGEIRKLLINVPPGCMKSLLTNVFFPAWEWGPKNMPWVRYIGASYNDSLTIRDNRRTRHLIRSDVYRKAWGDRFSIDTEQDAKTRFDTNHRGWKIASSVKGLGTGERADRFIIDDPHNVKTADSTKVREDALQWFTEVVPSRVNDMEKSSFIVIMQRVHELDISGLIIAKELGYEHLILPMEYEADRHCKTSIGFTDPRKEDGELLWPDRFSRRYIEDDLKPVLRAFGGTYAEAAQLQQRPAPRGGGLFKRTDFQIIDIAPKGGRVVRAYDLAGSTGDRSPYTVGVKIRLTDDKRIIFEDIDRGQWSPFEVEQRMLKNAELDGRDVEIDFPQDPGQAGKAQVAHLAKLLHGYRFTHSPETGSKEDRARPLAAQAESGNVYLLRGPWNDAFIQEAMVFPQGEFKDQIDAASRGYSNLVRRGKRLGPRVRRL